eukprot:CAMPEP_0171295516 /NCGR_PEP_ID=MMETSP0816-20121228/4096_1 /TAXON_ID=420281 /ORGANISM="Proboscia inermis, Strain CCAP1064/1" /LENGTH=359 /DNA_ID=CAMNT_0011768215 /DNA_START=99 /DNA_END=1178 /DNA_ORIENTATION=-
MTWGVQNDESDAHAQIDLARERGINFIDTAELYPVPLFVKEWRAGKTEELIGSYLSKVGSKARDEMVIASKIAGFMPRSSIATERYASLGLSPVEGEDCRLDADSIRRACDASLARLQTDRIDLYQIHWPDRSVPLFGQSAFQPNDQRADSISIHETAQALKDLIDAGKIRAIGLSNESSFGVGEWHKACTDLGIADKLATIQNSYSLLDRRFDTELAESCHHYGIGLLPWSILAGGLLSGKYRGGQSPEQARFQKYPRYMTRWSPSSASKYTLEAVDAYAHLAERKGMTLTELSIRFVKSRSHVGNGSTIIGATTLDQLNQNIDAFDSSSSDDHVLDEETLKEIDNIHLRCPNPSCSL